MRFLVILAMVGACSALPAAGPSVAAAPKGKKMNLAEMMKMMELYQAHQAGASPAAAPPLPSSANSLGGMPGMTGSMSPRVMRIGQALMQMLSTIMMLSEEFPRQEFAKKTPAVPTLRQSAYVAPAVPVPDPVAPAVPVADPVAPAARLPPVPVAVDSSPSAYVPAQVEETPEVKKARAEFEKIYQDQLIAVLG